MARYFVEDQSVVGIKYESGTWANSSGGLQWVGQTQSNDITDDKGVISSRYVGTASRNVSYFTDGPMKVAGKMSLFPQDFRMLLFSFGICADGGSPSPYTHTYTEANSSSSDKHIAGQVLPSFTIEDYKVVQTGSNFGRVINGCVVDGFELNFKPGNQVEMNIDYIGKEWNFASGAVSSFSTGELAARSGLSPFMWSHGIVQMPSGTSINEVKEGKFKMANTLDAPHYVNGSKVIGAIIPTSRDYNFDVILNATAEWSKTLYDQYYLGGSEFNTYVYLSASAGSRTLGLTMSGCRIEKMNTPTKMSGVVEQTLTIRPTSCSAIEESLIQFNNSGSFA